MKISGTWVLLISALVGQSDAFAPTTRLGAPLRSRTARSFSSLDPSHLTDLPNQLRSFQDALVSSSNFLADLDVDAMAGGVTAATQGVVDPQAAAEMANAASKSANNGWFGFLTGPTMGFLQLIHTGLVAVGLNKDAWGVSIIILTLTIKLLTFPLTKTQLESTNKMQALQPTIKDIQAKYQSNPEVMNQKIAEIYQTNQVNPLAGCIPSLVQIPIFVGLYRAVLVLANDNQLSEPFLWLPSLEGPVFDADPTKGSAWLFDGWVDGVPSLGWDDTLAYLILPIFLVISQYVSMQLMTPKDQAQQQPFVLKLLPLMIGWFSLNVPSALCVYWVVNNIVTTASSILIRNSLKMEPVSLGSGGGPAATSAPPTTSAFSPPTLREKPAGFASSGGTGPATTRDGVRPITTIDADVDTLDVVDVEVVESTAPQPKKRGTKKKKKRSS